jgi:hypothetical protein
MPKVDTTAIQAHWNKYWNNYWNSYWKTHSTSIKQIKLYKIKPDQIKTTNNNTSIAYIFDRIQHQPYLIDSIAIQSTNVGKLIIYNFSDVVGQLHITNTNKIYGLRTCVLSSMLVLTSVDNTINFNNVKVSFYSRHKQLSSNPEVIKSIKPVAILEAGNQNPLTNVLFDNVYKSKLGTYTEDSLLYWKSNSMPVELVFSLDKYYYISDIELSFVGWDRQYRYSYRVYISRDRKNWRPISAIMLSGNKEFNKVIVYKGAQYIKVLMTMQNHARWAALWEVRLNGYAI